jgi:integrase
VDLPREDLTVAKYLNRWLTDVLAGTVRASTMQQYTDVVRLYIIPTIGQRRIRTLTPRDVARMQRHLSTEFVRKNGEIGLAPHTVRIARSVLRRALRNAEREGQLGRNVASLARGVTIGSGDGRTLTPEQARALLAAHAGLQLPETERTPTGPP